MLRERLVQNNAKKIEALREFLGERDCKGNIDNLDYFVHILGYHYFCSDLFCARVALRSWTFKVDCGFYLKSDGGFYQTTSRSINGVTTRWIPVSADAYHNVCRSVNCTSAWDSAPFERVPLSSLEVENVFDVLISYFKGEAEADKARRFFKPFRALDQSLPAQLMELEKQNPEDYLYILKSLEERLEKEIGEVKISELKDLEGTKEVVDFAKSCGVVSDKVLEIYENKKRELKKRLRRL